MAVANSVIQNACHTPTASKNRLKIKATGIINKAYRSKEITKEGVPIPNPSSAPQEMIEMEETINPMLIILRAVLPAAIVSAFVENSPINRSGINQHRMVPTVMMQAESASVTRYIFSTLTYSFAPKLYPIIGRIPCTIPFAGRYRNVCSL